MFNNIVGSPVKVYVLLSIVMGMTLVIIIPPFQTPDENIHFYRAYEISELRRPATRWKDVSGSDLPTSIRQTEIATHGVLGSPRTPGVIAFNFDEKYKLHYTKEALKIPLNQKEKMFYPTSSIPLYNPLPYLPQAAIVAVLRAFGTPIIIMVYVIRVVNLLLLTLGIMLAIRLVPRRKWTFVSVGLLPVVITQGVSMGNDPVLMAACAVFIAMIYRALIEEEYIITAKRYLILLVATTIAILSKPILILFTALYLIIPKNKISFNKNYVILLSKVALIIIPILFYLSWGLLAGSAGGDNMSSSQAQIHRLIQNPFIFPIEVLQFMLLYTSSANIVVQSLVGNFGWLDAPVSTPVVLIGGIGIALLFLLSYDKREKNLNLTSRLILSMTILAYILAVLLSMFIYFTKPDEPHIRGVQGRYFIPALFLGALIWQRDYLKVKENRYKRLALATIFALFGITILTLLARYYLPYYMTFNA